MSTLSSANVTDVNLVLNERTHMRLCLNMLIFTHNLGNWLIALLTGSEAWQQQHDPAADGDTERHAEAADESRHCTDDEGVLDWHQEHVDCHQEEHVAHQEPEQHTYAHNIIQIKTYIAP